MVRSFVWRDVSGTVGGGRSDGRWTVVSSDTNCHLSSKINLESSVNGSFLSMDRNKEPMIGMQKLKNSSQNSGTLFQPRTRLFFIK